MSARLKRTVEERFGHVRLRGEISGWKRAASGHAYLALKDDAALIDGVMWKGTAGRIAFAPEDGLDVIVTGKVTTYPGRSKYQIVIESMELAGEGALMQLFERMKAKLAAEGLFDPARRRPIPMLPGVIGVVTSPTGAVIRDILHRLADRFPSRVLLWPVLVQGEGAAAQIANAVRGFGALDGAGPIPRPDVLIVARGGGSIEDLWAFNEEAVVRAVAASPIPVISAVGHETDTTLCDFAADLRAPTPTAAAELASAGWHGLRQRLPQLQQALSRAGQRHLQQQAQRLDELQRRLTHPRTRLSRGAERLKHLGQRLEHAAQVLQTRRQAQLAHLRSRLLARLPRSAPLRARLDSAAQRLEQGSQRQLRQARQNLDALAARLAALNPQAVLARGYAIVRTDAGDILRHASEARHDERLTIQLADSELIVRARK